MPIFHQDSGQSTVLPIVDTLMSDISESLELTGIYEDSSSGQEEKAYIDVSAQSGEIDGTSPPSREAQRALYE